MMGSIRSSVGTSPERLPAEAAQLLNHRFIIVAGKGGVGKSTMAMSLALAAAQSGRRTLLYQYGAQGVGRTPLADRDVGESIVALRPRLYAIRPTTESGMREYAIMKLHSKTAYRIVFENGFIKKLLGAIPALNELIWLGKAFFHERERDAAGQPVWDTIVLDPPATGHSLYMFKVPFVLRDAVPSGPLFEDAQNMVELLQDPSRTALHLVTLPEEMPVNECIQLKAELDAGMRIPMAALLVNGVFPNLFIDDRALLDSLIQRFHEPSDVIARLLAAARFRMERRALQCHYIQRLRDAISLPLVELPYEFGGQITAASLEGFAERFLKLSKASAPLACERGARMRHDG
ncbi:MAG: ArsA-related P-loop ATPase [Myxococcota bacterium]|jgi:anion-transporting  ArsA/GET3 family ATPase|nr:ArsA-related P-loop ATPase [Myxococcota bacterium]